MSTNNPNRLQQNKLLQNQMVWRRPSAEQLRRRTPIALTERDLEILTDVHKHGFLTAELIELGHFPEHVAPRADRSSCCYDRLRSLWFWNYLYRVELPIAPSVGGRRPYLYTLGRAGVPHVEARLSDGPPVQVRRLERLHDLYRDHDLRASALWASLKAVVRASRVCRFDWRAERDLRARKLWVRDPRSDARLPVLPDAFFQLWYADGTVQSVIVEVDMGTHALAKFRRKIRAFELFAAAGGFGQHFGADDVEVWLLAPTAKRLENLRRAARAEVPPERVRSYFLASFDALTPDGITGGGWLDLDGATTYAFYDACDEPNESDAAPSEVA